jgi:hypothetical protein
LLEIITFIGLVASWEKGATAFAATKDISHNHEHPPPLVSIYATGVRIPIGNNEVLLAAVGKS